MADHHEPFAFSAEERRKRDGKEGSVAILQSPRDRLPGCFSWPLRSLQYSGTGSSGDSTPGAPESQHFRSFSRSLAHEEPVMKRSI